MRSLKKLRRRSGPLSQNLTVSAAAGVIEDIAEQTNLLPNAAIGRHEPESKAVDLLLWPMKYGLAQKTQDTTSDIHRVINDLSVSVSAVDMAAGGSESAAGGLSKVNEMEIMLKSISWRLMILLLYRTQWPSRQSVRRC